MLGRSAWYTSSRVVYGGYVGGSGGQDSVFAAHEGPDYVRLLETLQQLLAIRAATFVGALQEACDLLVGAMRADTVDGFLYDDASDSLVARASSRTPMAQRQRQLGLHCQPLTDGGSTVWVFATHMATHTGHAEQNPRELRVVQEDLGVRSQIATPLNIGGRNRGVLQAWSTQPDHFSVDDLLFLQAVSHWLGLVAHRVELLETLQPDSSSLHVAHQEAVAALHERLQEGDQDVADPETASRVYLLRWKMQRLEESRHETEAALAAVEAAFAESQRQIGALAAALHSNQERLTQHEERLAQQVAVAQEAVRTRRKLEEKLRHTEDTIAWLTLHHTLSRHS